MSQTRREFIRQTVAVVGSLSTVQAIQAAMPEVDVQHVPPESVELTPQPPRLLEYFAWAEVGCIPPEPEPLQGTIEFVPGEGVEMQELPDGLLQLLMNKELGVPYGEESRTPDLHTGD